MNEQGQPESVEDEFDRLWEEADDDDASAVAQEPDPEAPEAAQPEALASAESERGQPPAEPEPEPEPEATPQPQPPGDELDTLRHKIKSAQGRYDKFGEQICDMEAELTQKEQAAQPEPVPLPLPEGWKQEDWDDYSADHPVEAELLEQQNRQVQQLKEKVDVTERQEQERRAQETHEQAIRQVHGDYYELLGKERTQLETFITHQANPILRQAYQAVYQSGNAQQVTDLITAYKANRGERPSSDSDHRRIDDALAVPSRAPMPSSSAGRSGLPDSDDFDAAWDYFSDEAID